MSTVIDDADASVDAAEWQPLYELRGVERVFRAGGTEVRAVDGVDADIYPGELVAVEGPSGSGKTTMLQLLGCLDKATAGSVRLGGVELTTIDDKELTAMRARDLGFVFQSFNLIPTLTAAENVEAAMVTQQTGKDERQRRATELLEWVGLANRAGHLPSKLSGGEQQRVAIARALANNPRVILADEPTGNLDSATAEEVVGILRWLSEEQSVTVIIVTHDEDVARHAHRRLRMRDGRILDDSIFEPDAEG